MNSSSAGPVAAGVQHCSVLCTKSTQAANQPGRLCKLGYCHSFRTTRPHGTGQRQTKTHTCKSSGGSMLLSGQAQTKQTAPSPLLLSAARLTCCLGYQSLTRTPAPAGRVQGAVHSSSSSSSSSTDQSCHVRRLQEGTSSVANHCSTAPCDSIIHCAETACQLHAKAQPLRAHLSWGRVAGCDGRGEAAVVDEPLACPIKVQDVVREGGSRSLEVQVAGAHTWLRLGGGGLQQE
jgi:hypothetical protein